MTGTQTGAAKGALDGLRVLDLSRVLAGPWAGQILGDLGAEVIKVRAWGPPYLNDGQGAPTSESAYYLSANRNKQSVTIDITRPEGQRLVKELVAESDVLLENFKVGGLKRYGLDYASLAAINPRLIYCSITGFGQDGPYAERPGYDFLIQGLGGLMSITGQPDGEPGGGPVKAGVALTDITTGLYAAIAVLAAVNHRHQTGQGQHIDMALLDVQVATLANQAMNFLTSGTAPGRMGNAHPNIVPYQTFPAADGDIILTIGNDGQFARFCEVAGRPEWASDERYATNAARVANRDTLIPALRQTTVMKTTAEWLRLLEEAGVPGGPVNTIEQVFQDPQVQHRGLRIDLSHPLTKSVPLVGSPLRLSGSPVRYASAPPLLGEHTGDVLSQVLGLDAAAIEQLRRDGVI
ncbi:CaiB/BaiF CoA transferase family protein [Alloalcanivorax venustensis]|uniref:CaiB/BaiF CoA transferase family protein n=2 Tax=Alloalcanivorax venustensis TaxID=172371 RepID=UPI003C42AC02